MEMKEFDERDWSAFSGSEAWPDGAAPLIAHGAFESGGEYVLVLDRNSGCLVIADDPQNDYGGYILPVLFPTQAAARTFARGLGAPHRRDDFLAVGFQVI